MKRSSAGPMKMKIPDSILENPGDDAPRLVWADALQDQGDPLGEFIQLQIALETTPEGTERRRMKLAEGKLLRAHQAKWIGALAKVEYLEPVFRRGFVHRIQCDVSRFAESRQKILDGAPLLRELSLLAGFGEYAPAQSPAEIFAEERLAQITKLELEWSGLGDSGVKALSETPVVENLVSLAIHGSFAELEDFIQDDFGGEEPEHLTDAGVDALASTKRLTKLRELDLARNRVTNDGVARIAERWPLERLALAQNRVSSGVTELLAKMRTLRSLDLSGSGVTSRALSHLAALPHLDELSLADCTAELTDIEPLLDGSLPALRRVDLSTNRLGVAGAKAIAAAEGVRHWEKLTIAQNGLGAEGIRALAASPNLRALRYLLLAEPRVPAEIKTELAASEHLREAVIYFNGARVARKEKKKRSQRASG